MTTKGLVYARSASGENLDEQARRGVEKLRNLGVEDINVITVAGVAKRNNWPNLTGYTHLYLQDISRLSRDVDASTAFCKEAKANGITLVFDQPPMFDIAEAVAKHFVSNMTQDDANRISHAFMLAIQNRTMVNK